MAFTGAAVVKKVAENLYRITGVSLASGDSGTIGLTGHATAEVELPQTDDWQPYADVTLQDAIQCWCAPVADVSAFAVPIRIVKSGDTNDDFLITLTNDAAATNSAALEIYVRLH